MERVFIFCDNFQIGGIQRLTLDQAYYLNSIGVETLIIVLGERPDSHTPSFLFLEESLIKSLGLDFVFVQGGKFSQFFEILKLMNGKKNTLAICHSLRATVLIFFARIFSKNRIRSVTTIHQLLSMSAPVQRIRRILYSQFSDQLFGYSLAVIDDWNYRRNHNPFICLISSRRKIALCRNGVYLPRLYFDSQNQRLENFKIERLLFINRITSWKGLSTFLELLKNPKFNGLKIMIMTPTDPESFLTSLSPEVRHRIQKVIGKSVSQIDFAPGDLHLYPANYGETSKYVEGVSINVLELASLGVRSIVTEKGLSTWPDLVSLGIVKATDWNKINDVENSIKECESGLDVEKIMLARDIVDVKNNLLTLLAKMSPDICLRIELIAK